MQTTIAYNKIRQGGKKASPNKTPALSQEAHWLVSRLRLQFFHGLCVAVKVLQSRLAAQCKRWLHRPRDSEGREQR